MNKVQRKQLQKALDIITSVSEEEQEKLSNMYDNFSETQRYQSMEEKADELQQIVDDLEYAMESEY